MWSGDEDETIMIADSLVRNESGVSIFMQGGSSLLSMTAILACGQARKPRGKLIFSELL